MRLRLLSLALLLPSLFIVGCSSGEKPAAASAPAAAPQAVTDQPEPHYTTTKASGTLADLIPQGYEIITAEQGQVVAKGDLNADNQEDKALLLQSMDTEETRTMILIAYGDGQGGYTAGEQSGDLGPEPVMYPDLGQLQIAKGILTFHYQSMRWGADLKFRRESKYGDLRLIGSETENFGNAVHDGAGNVSTNFLTGQRISNIMSWDEEKQDLIELPEKRETVSRDLRGLQDFNLDNIYDVQ